MPHRMLGESKHAFIQNVHIKGILHSAAIVALHDSDMLCGHRGIASADDRDQLLTGDKDSLVRHNKYLKV